MLSCLKGTLAYEGAVYHRRTAASWTPSGALPQAVFLGPDAMCSAVHGAGGGDARDRRLRPGCKSVGHALPQLRRHPDYEAVCRLSHNCCSLCQVPSI